MACFGTLFSFSMYSIDFLPLWLAWGLHITFYNWNNLIWMIPVSQWHTETLLLHSSSPPFVTSVTSSVSVHHAPQTHRCIFILWKTKSEIIDWIYINTSIYILLQNFVFPVAFFLLSSALSFHLEELPLGFLVRQVWCQWTLSFCLSGNVWISPSFLKDIFAR